jgi:hypothetical protein
MTAIFATQIELDDHGVAWIGGTKVKVTEVVLDKIAYGWSPENPFSTPASFASSDPCRADLLL